MLQTTGHNVLLYKNKSSGHDQSLKELKGFIGAFKYLWTPPPTVLFYALISQSGDIVEKKFGAVFGA